MTSEEKRILREQIEDIEKPPVPEWYGRFEEATSVEELTIPTRVGSVKVYLVTPQERNKSKSLLVNIHGGGFIWPHREYDTAFCRRVAVQTGTLVADIDYGLAPQYPYPAGLHQCYDAVSYLVSHREQFDFDPEKLLISGSSSGANFATAVCLMAAETKEFRFLLEILLYPPTDLYTDPALKHREGEDILIPPERARSYNMLYIDSLEQAKEPYASPLFAPEALLRKMPDTILYTASADALRFEGEEYALRLMRAGVQVTCKRWPDSNHGFTFFYTPQAFACLDQIIGAIRHYVP